MRRLCAVLLAGLAPACTVIDHQRVAGWPQLEVIETYVPHAQMLERCVRYTAFGMSPAACAEFNLGAGKCTIWYSADFPPSKLIVEHERLHCRGYDHIGESTMAQLLRRHQARPPSPRAY
ncbi:MAG TPA: hypothetical protein VMN03_09475 [Burkholderiales bacterium]|nr:hypothetical protein [Burkholderiales bacterium]